MNDHRALMKLGQEIRAAREQAGLAQQHIADVFGWGRDAISKLERGDLNIGLCDYLEIIRFLREVLPADHPAVALADYVKPVRHRRQA